MARREQEFARREQEWLEWEENERKKREEEKLLRQQEEEENARRREALLAAEADAERRRKLEEEAEIEAYVKKAQEEAQAIAEEARVTEVLLRERRHARIASGEAQVHHDPEVDRGAAHSDAQTANSSDVGVVSGDQEVNASATQVELDGHGDRNTPLDANSDKSTTVQAQPAIAESSAVQADTHKNFVNPVETDRASSTDAQVNREPHVEPVASSEAVAERAIVSDVHIDAVVSTNTDHVATADVQVALPASSDSKIELAPSSEPQTLSSDIQTVSIVEPTSPVMRSEASTTEAAPIEEAKEVTNEKVEETVAATQ